MYDLRFKPGSVMCFSFHWPSVPLGLKRVTCASSAKPQAWYASKNSYQRPCVAALPQEACEFEPRQSAVRTRVSKSPRNTAQRRQRDSFEDRAAKSLGSAFSERALENASRRERLRRASTPLEADQAPSGSPRVIATSSGDRDTSTAQSQLLFADVFSRSGDRSSSPRRPRVADRISRLVLQVAD